MCGLKVMGLEICRNGGLIRDVCKFSWTDDEVGLMAVRGARKMVSCRDKIIRIKGM